MTRFEITAEIDGWQTVKHVIRAPVQMAAWLRMERAYKGRACRMLKCRELLR